MHVFDLTPELICPREKKCENWCKMYYNSEGSFFSHLKMSLLVRSLHPHSAEQTIQNKSVTKKEMEGKANIYFLGLPDLVIAQRSKRTCPQAVIGRFSMFNE